MHLQPPDFKNPAIPSSTCVDLLTRSYENRYRKLHLPSLASKARARHHSTSDFYRSRELDDARCFSQRAGTGLLAAPASLVALLGVEYVNDDNLCSTRRRSSGMSSTPSAPAKSTMTVRLLQLGPREISCRLRNSSVERIRPAQSTYAKLSIW